MFSWLERLASVPAREGCGSRPDRLMNVPAGHCEQAPVLQTGEADLLRNKEICLEAIRKWGREEGRLPVP